MNGVNKWMNNCMNERSTTSVTPPVAQSLHPLRQTLNVRYCVPDRKGYIYRSGVEWRPAIPYCGQWVLLCGAGYCAAQGNSSALRSTSSA